MKKTVLIAALLCVVGLLLLAVPLMGDGLLESEPHIQTDETYSTEGITSVVLEGYDAEAVVRSGSENEIRIETDTPESRPFEITSKNGVLRIVRRDHRAWYQKFGIFLSPREYDLRITLPAEWKASCSFTLTSGSLSLSGLTLDGELTMRVSSGRLSADTLSAASVTASTSSGALRINGIKNANNVTLSALSGALRAENITDAAALSASTTSGSLSLTEVHITDRLAASTTSGALSVTESSARTAELSTTSGQLSANTLGAESLATRSVSGGQSLRSVRVTELRAEASSGGIRLQAADIAEHCSVKATSGSIRCELKNQRSEFTVSVNTGSGGSNLSSGGDGQKRLELSTTSGGIRAFFGVE